MLNSSVETLSRCIGHALYSGNFEVKYQTKDWKKSSDQGEDVMTEVIRAHEPHELEVAAMFAQTWGSTALGFGGIGGAAMTDAYVVILRSTYTNEHFVYFGGKFAYRVKIPNEKFLEDMKNKDMADVAKQAQYERGYRR